MNNSYCICQQLLASYGADCCTNCGQPHYEAAPSLAQPNMCCAARPCMMCCAYKDQNMYNVRDELPTKDLNGNRNLIQDQAALKNNYAGGSHPYSRTYSLASTPDTSPEYRKTSFSKDAPTIPTNIPEAPDARTYMFSCKRIRTPPCGICTCFNNVSIPVDESTNTSNHSTVSVEDANDLWVPDQIVAADPVNPSSVSTLGGWPIIENSMPPIQEEPAENSEPSHAVELNLAQKDNSIGVVSQAENILPLESFVATMATSPPPYMYSTRNSGVKNLWQQQAGELAKMRHCQEIDLRFLEMQDPSPQLKYQIDELMIKQQEEQLRLQEKHRQQLENDLQERRSGDNGRRTSYRDPTSQEDELRLQEYDRQQLDNDMKERRTGNDGRGTSYRNSSSPAKKCNCANYTNEGVMQQGDGTNKERQATNVGMGKDCCGCCTCKSPSISSFGPTKSAPTVLTPFVSNFLSSLAFDSGTEPGGTLGIDRERHINAHLASKTLYMDALHADHSAALQREMAAAHRSRQRIADAMAQLTFKQTQVTVERVGQQREENAIKAIEQRFRDTQAAEYDAAIQREKDSIEAAKLRIQSAKIEADSRREVERLALEDLKLHEEKLSKLKQKEIDLAEAAIRRQLAEEEAAAALRQFKDNDLHRARLLKEQTNLTRNLQSIQLADMTRKRKNAELSAAEAAKMRLHEATEGEIRKKTMEDIWQQHQRELEADAAAEARLRQEREAVADAERQLEMKKAAWYRELQALQAANRRKDEQEDADRTAKKRRMAQAARDQGNQMALQQVAVRLQAEEQAFEEQKRKLLEGAAADRNKRRQMEQEQEINRKINATNLQQSSVPQKTILHIPPVEKTVEKEAVKKQNIYDTAAIAPVFKPQPPVATSTLAETPVERKTAGPLNLDPVENAKRRTAAEALLAEKKKASRSCLGLNCMPSKQDKTKEEIEIEKAKKRQIEQDRNLNRPHKSRSRQVTGRSMTQERLAAIRKSKENLKSNKTKDEEEFEKAMDAQIEKARMRKNKHSPVRPPIKGKMTPERVAAIRKSREALRGTKTKEEEEFEAAMDAQIAKARLRSNKARK